MNNARLVKIQNLIQIHEKTHKIWGFPTFFFCYSSCVNTHYCFI